MIMSYEWTPEDRAKLTPGCTVVHEHDGTRTVGTAFCGPYRDAGGEDQLWMAPWERDNACADNAEWFVRTYEHVERSTAGRTFTGWGLENCDPASIQAPTLATLNRMAVEDFGEGASVEYVGACFVGCLRVKLPDGGRVTFDLSADDEDTRECARWLAARGK